MLALLQLLLLLFYRQTWFEWWCFFFHHSWNVFFRRQSLNSRFVLDKNPRFNFWLFLEILKSHGNHVLIKRKCFTWDETAFFAPLKYQLFQRKVHSCKICITLQLWSKWNVNWFTMNNSCFHCLQFAFGRGAIVSPPRGSNYIFKLKYVLLLHLNIAHQKQKVCILWSCRAIICHCTLYFSS